ncbi:DUF4157 domain-containing protein [Deinococcus sp.]|uniref:eCIS core domain-containing protein n=1 Tax=Deinococcus sp. TaxID=47478 RepID=UPI0025BD6870|nr:DUF4157 domain-containing protein [Deinococcus sp.]
MEYVKKKNKSSAQSTPAALTPKLALNPAQWAEQAAEHQAALQRQKEWRAAHDLFTFTSRDVSVKRSVARPALSALSLFSQAVQQVEGARPALQRQVAALKQTYTPEAVQAAIQREQDRTAPTSVIRNPQTNTDWVTVMRQQAEQADGKWMGARESGQFTALQRQIAQTLTRNYLRDRQPPLRRHAEYAQHVVALQRHPLSEVVGQVFMRSVPASERPTLQRAVDAALQREAELQTQDAGALELHSLQRQLAELDEQASIPVMQRIQARKGAGSPLPADVLGHLEQGLNHDLSGVRIHDDAEADRLAKSVNAIAFTTGTDIFFQAGKYEPNTQTGLELLGHEVTHTVQQSRGNVPKGIDGDAGLELEARQMGRVLARAARTQAPGRGVRTVAAQTARVSGALQRQAVKEEPAFLKTLTAGQAPQAPFGFVWQTKDGGVFIRETLGGNGKVLVKVPNKTRLQLLRYEPNHKAYAVRTSSGVQGWVAASHLKVPPSHIAQDAGLRFYVPKDKEGIFAVVGREYGATEFGQDARYFTNVLRAVNQPAAFMVKDPKYKGFLEAGYERVITAMTEGRDANGVQLISGVPFWLPSPAAAKKIKAPSGSFSKQVLDTTKGTFGAAGEKALFGGLFLTGLQVGLLKSLWDALVGLVEMVKLPVTVVTSIYNVIQTALQGQLLNKVQEIYAFLVGGGLKEIANMLVGDFKAGWDNKNPLKAWGYRGQVIGYVATEIIVTFIPIAGIVLKAAKAGKVLAFLSSKFKWIGEAGKKAMALLDKVKIPQVKLGPEFAMAGGIPMSAPQQELTLGQVLRMAKPKVGGAGTAALSKAEQLAQNAANWPKVKKLIGKDPPATLPEGYFYRTQGTRRQIVRTNADDDKFAALTIDEKGKVRVADPSVSDRISDPTKMNKNFKLAMGREKLEGYQLHHLIPDNKVRSHPLMQWAQEKRFYDLDHIDNLIEMPGTVVARTKATQEGLDNGVEIIGHFGSHMEYDVIVQQRLDELYRLMRKNFGTDLTEPGAR